MKKIIFTLALIFAVTVVSAQDNPFEKFTDMDGVTSVFISKNMMALFPKDSNQFGGVSINSFVDKLSSSSAYYCHCIEKLFVEKYFLKGSYY
jgi:hypothetical protein